MSNADGESKEVAEALMMSAIGIPYPRPKFPETANHSFEAAEKIEALLDRGHSWGYIGDLHSELLDALMKGVKDQSN